MLKLFVLTALGAGVAALWAAAPPPEDLKPGDAAPPFSLPGSDGRTHTLAALKGRTVVLAWFPKAFTGGWTAECKSLRASGEQLKAYDVVYFMASVDPADTNRQFAEANGADFPILSDPEKTAAAAYGVLNPGGAYARRWTFYIGPDGTILDVDRAVSAKTAGEDMVARLQTLGVKKRQ